MPRLDTLRSALRLLHAQADRPVLLGIGGTLLLVGISGTFAACSPLALKHLVDALAASTQGHQPGGYVLAQGAVYLLVLLVSRLAADVRPLLAGKVEQRVLAGLRQRFFAHLLRLPMSYLVKRHGGELLHSVDLAAAGSQLIISHVTNSIAPVLVELVVMAVILAQLQQPALVVLFAATAVTYLGVFSFGALRLTRQANAVSAASLDVHTQLTDGIAHVETLRCFSAGPQAEKAMAEASSRLACRWLEFNRRTVGTALAASVLFAVALAASSAIAADAVAQGQMTVGGFVLTNVYMLQMVRPLEVLGSAARDLARALGFMRPLLGILAEPTEPAEAARCMPPTSATASGSKCQPSAPSLRLENLHFGYEPCHPVIRGLNLEIPAGRTTAIVGRSGSGKSSLVRLLLRLYLPQAGHILLDGRPIEALPMADLRALIGLVPQECALLHATAASNIALGVPGASREDIELAARIAQLHHILEALPRGYDTLLGERGQTLSGGERQRLAIARALLRRPTIFLLDEPTSMLDSKTEAEIMAALRRVTAGCTTLVIAHRLSTAMHADEIVVLDGGQIHERGRHLDLLASGGLYAQLWRQQMHGAVWGN
ncbi:MAG: ABC transporter ATP-binding protein [Burkholderiales bacterium]|nr:ABC transporter ATP-binding protein [Burkholderiales bacterium]